jgi:hypothetical protein
MHIRTPHSAYEADDSERNRWAPLLILAASFVAWACIVLGGVQFAKWMGWL